MIQIRRQKATCSSHVITWGSFLHIWSLKEAAACDDSDMEAEGKMSSHAITKARSFSCKAERKPSHVTIQIWRQKAKCRRMQPQRLDAPHVNLKRKPPHVTIQIWRQKAKCCPMQPHRLHHVWGRRKATMAIQTWGLKPAVVCEHSHVTANKATIKSVTCVQSNMEEQSRHMWAFRMRAGKT